MPPILELDPTDVACDALISKTLDGMVIGWSAGAEKLFGYTAEEMIGQPILRLFPAEFQPEEDAILASLKRGERIECHRTIRLAKGGLNIQVSLRIIPVKDHGGHIVGALKIVRDVTHEQRSEVDENSRHSCLEAETEVVPVLAREKRREEVAAPHAAEAALRDPPPCRLPTVFAEFHRRSRVRSWTGD